MVRTRMISSIIYSMIILKNSLEYIIKNIRKIEFFFSHENKTYFKLQSFDKHKDTIIVKFNFKYNSSNSKIRAVEITELYRDPQILQGFSKEEMTKIFYQYVTISMKKGNN
jgi:hypothetical protein